MEELRFVCGVTSEDIFLSNDFLLEYDWVRNMKGSNAWFRVIALPAITGLKHCGLHLGHVWISDRELSPYFVHRSHPSSNVADEDVLTQTMGFNSSFRSIPRSFHSLLFPEVAKRLFILLSPDQRLNFVNALNVITDEPSFHYCYESHLLPQIVMRDYDCWEKWECPSPIRKYLFSDINFKDLPVKEFYNKK